MEYGNFGHARIKNRGKSNTSLKKEQTGSDQIPAPGREQMKKLIRYSALLDEVEALCKLKTLMGHFQEEEEVAFRQAAGTIIEALVDCSMGIPPDTVKRMASDGEYIRLLDDISYHWRDVRNLRGYARTAMNHLIG